MLEERANLRSRTRELYVSELKCHILPPLGAIEVGSLTTGRVRTWHAAMLNAGRPGPTTVAKCYRLLRAIMGTAVEDGLLAKNPCTIKGAGTQRPSARVDAVLAQPGHPRRPQRPAQGWRRPLRPRGSSDAAAVPVAIDRHQAVASGPASYRPDDARRQPPVGRREVVIASRISPIASVGPRGDHASVRARWFEAAPDCAGEALKVLGVGAHYEIVGSQRPFCHTGVDNIGFARLGGEGADGTRPVIIEGLDMAAAQELGK